MAGKGTIPDCVRGAPAAAIAPLGFDHREEESAFDGAERVVFAVEIDYEGVEFVFAFAGRGLVCVYLFVACHRCCLFFVLLLFGGVDCLPHEKLACGGGVLRGYFWKLLIRREI